MFEKLISNVLFFQEKLELILLCLGMNFDEMHVPRLLGRVRSQLGRSLSKAGHRCCLPGGLRSPWSNCLCPERGLPARGRGWELLSRALLLNKRSVDACSSLWRRISELEFFGCKQQKQMLTKQKIKSVSFFPFSSLSLEVVCSAHEKCLRGRGRAAPGIQAAGKRVHLGGCCWKESKLNGALPAACACFSAGEVRAPQRQCPLRPHTMGRSLSQRQLGSYHYKQRNGGYGFP